MPQLVVNMIDTVRNKHYRNTKIIVSKCGTQHIQTVRPHRRTIVRIQQRNI